MEQYAYTGYEVVFSYRDGDFEVIRERVDQDQSYGLFIEGYVGARELQQLICWYEAFAERFSGYLVQHHGASARGCAERTERTERTGTTERTGRTGTTGSIEKAGSTAESGGTAGTGAAGPSTYTKQQSWVTVYRSAGLSICHKANLYFVFLEPFKAASLWELQFYLQDVIDQLRTVEA